MTPSTSSAVSDSGQSWPLLARILVFSQANGFSWQERSTDMDSNPDVTLLAAILSQRAFEDVVRAGYTGSLHPDRFEQVTAEVPGKDFAQPGWLYVPKPSRRNAPSHNAPSHSAAAEPNATPSSATTTVHGNVGNSISGGTVMGNVRQSGGIPS